MLAPWKKIFNQPRQHIKKQRHYFAEKGSFSQSCGFSSSHVWMWELDHKEDWAPKNCCFWTVVLEKTLESPLHCKKIQTVHPKGYQSWMFIGSTDVEVESQLLWPPDAKNWLIGKDPDVGKDWRQNEKGTPEDEMVGWHHWLNGLEFELALEVGDGQGGLACCSPRGHKELDMTEWLNWLMYRIFANVYMYVCMYVCMYVEWGAIAFSDKVNKEKENLSWERKSRNTNGKIRSWSMSIRLSNGDYKTSMATPKEVIHEINNWYTERH